MSIEPAFTPPYEERRRVGTEDLDERMHVNNVVYLRWVSEIAVAHWSRLASPAVRAEIAWVARRHEIDYLSSAVLDDELVLRTWVGPADGLAFQRFTEVRRAADDKLLARARTLWIPVDATTGRPRRVSAEVRALVSVPAPDPA